MPDDSTLLDTTSTDALLNPPEIGETLGSPEEQPETKSSTGAGAGGAAPAAPLTAEDVRKLVSESTGELQDRLTAAEHTNAYLRGRLSEVGQSQRPAEPEQPKPFEYDMDQLAKDMETDAPRALTGYLRGLVQHELGNIRGDLTKAVDGRVGLNERRRSLNDAYQRDVQSVMSRYGELVKDKNFIKDADSAILELVQARGGRDINDYQPGDLISAASRVYGDWALSGKVKPGSVGSSSTQPSLQEVRQRPLSDNGFGEGRNGNGAALGRPPKSIDELFSSPRDRQIAKGIFKQFHEAEPNLTEDKWVASYLRAKEEDADFDR